MTEGYVLGPEEGKHMGLPIPGSAVVFKVWGEREPGDHDIVEFIFDPGCLGPRPHIHRKHEEVFYVLEGEFEFLVGDRGVRLGPGSVTYIPPGTVHDFRNPGPVLARCLLISCPSGLDRYFEDMAALGLEGRFSEAALHDLRLKYDTDEVEMVWSP